MEKSFGIIVERFAEKAAPESGPERRKTAWDLEN